MKYLIWITFSSLLITGSCQMSVKEADTELNDPKAGIWRGVISLNDSIDVPFNFELHKLDSSYKVVIFNADEKIEITDITETEDSLKIQMPVFANYLLVEKGGQELSGNYIRPDADDYILPFHARYGDSVRFPVTDEKCCDINNKWRVVLSPGTDDEDPAIAYFKQEGNIVTGSFVTETGDYRYLEGVISGDMLSLSTYDGSNLYYFEARIIDGQKMEGLRYSGRSFMEPWIAFRDEDFQLPDADSRTFLKEGFDGIDFKYPNLDGDTVELADFAGRPIIITIMGTWCPNCMDEARYLIDLDKTYGDQGLAIVGLTFERVRDRETATRRALKMKNDLNIPYPVLLAGVSKADNPDDAFPMLNDVMGYPTTIYLNRNHKVVKIHSGFTGPGTPLYDDFVLKNKSFIESQLLSDDGSNKSLTNRKS